MPDRTARTPATLPGWLQYIEEQHPQKIELGLDRVKSVAARLGVHKPAPVSIIIAGTNGKGSTTTFAEAVLLGAGLSVGATLSPHLHVFNERIRVNGRCCGDAELVAAFERVEAARNGVPLTYFEFAALAALQVFRSAAVDVAVLEVGLGGRLDAFNIVDAEVAVVTSIGLDHQSFLGDDLETIGREKAGVFRVGQKVVLGGDVTESVRAQARALGCAVVEPERGYRVEGEADGSWRFAGLGLDLPALPAGGLAPENCAMGLCAARLALEAGDGADREYRRITDDLVRAAVTRAKLPGRLETVAWRDRRVLLDVAHNPAGAQFLSAQLRARGYGPVIGIIGSLGDKDTEGVARNLAANVRRWVCVGVDDDRGLPAAEVAERVAGVSPCETAPDAESALDQARSLTGPGDVILVCGSFSIVGQVRAFLNEMKVDHG
ncbi:MAG: bifunctional tetrahydrofolate synthase/dihydrofolate synthase [Pseudomonadales bacterium]|nr:bifunctional folylpolyglutamate synthase/dihydrofolate synthase [Pseudomonadales bacterium]NIX08788.1 bifunctional tetrahydrofolate synthase/dihydrofolate synthase [Pseudomonadales bacterium]